MSKFLALSCTLMLPSLAMAGSELKIFQPEFQSNSTLSALSLTEENTVDIELVDAIALTLRHNRSIRSAYLTRIAQKFDLKVARDQYAPQLSIKVSYLRNRNHTDRYRQTQLKPAVSQLTPYGTRLSLDWAYAETRADVAGRRFNDGANFLIIQPLLRGAGRAIASAPLRQAQLTEQFNRLALKLEVAQVITRTITLYRSLLRAQEQLRIAQEGLLRAKQLVEVNRALIKAGRMAAVDIVQAEAEVASQTLAREGSRNYLQQSRLALAQLLAVDLSTALRAVETLEAQPLRVNTDQALRRAELLQPTYLMQRVAREQATIDLEVAKDAQLWNLSLIGGASQFRERPDHQRMWEHYVGLELEVPIDDLSRRQTLV